MNIALTPHFETLIAALVKSGRFNNASEVVRAALRAFEANEAQSAPLLPPGALRRLYTRSANAAERKTALASVTQVEDW